MSALDERVMHAGDQVIAALWRTQSLLKLETTVAAGDCIKAVLADSRIRLTGVSEMTDALRFSLTSAVRSHLGPQIRTRLQSLSDRATEIIARALPDLEQLHQDQIAAALDKSTDARTKVTATRLTADERHAIHSMRFEGKTYAEHVQAGTELTLKRIVVALERHAKAVQQPGDFAPMAGESIETYGAELSVFLQKTLGGFFADVQAGLSKPVLSRTA